MIAFAHHLSRPYVLVLLAGALHPSPLRRQLDLPVLALPLSAQHTLLDAWLETIANTAAHNEAVKIVVSSPRDAETMRGLVNDSQPKRFGASDQSVNIEVIVDPAQWRGPAGLLRDIARQSQLSGDTVVVAAEAAVLPPRSLNPVLRRRAEPELAGAIGAGAFNRPAGVYSFSSETIMSIPSIGFHDIKEQLLPSLHQRGAQVPVVPIMDEVIRIRDLDSYLRAVRSTLQADQDVHDEALISSSERIKLSPSAVLSGSCVIQDGVSIEDGAVVHDSVLLAGAQIGGGAVITRSVIGPGSLVHARSIVRSAVVSAVDRPMPRHGASRRLLRRPFSSLSIAHETPGGPPQ